MNERLPGVCMNRRARYAAVRWSDMLATRPLTDKKIARYVRQGRYGPGRFRRLDTDKGRLVWSA